MSWTVISDARKSVMPAWKKGSPRVILNELKEQGPVWVRKEFIVRVLTEVSDASAVLLLGKNADGEWVTRGSISSSRPSGSWLWLFIGRCLLPSPEWTRLRTIEVIALGHRGERAKSKIISARANPVATSVLVGLSRIRPIRDCSEQDMGAATVPAKRVKKEEPVPFERFCSAFGQAACAWQQRCAPIDANDACEEGFSAPCSAALGPKSLARFVPVGFRYDDADAASWLASLRDADCSSDAIILAPESLFHPLEGPPEP